MQPGAVEWQVGCSGVALLSVRASWLEVPALGKTDFIDDLAGCKAERSVCMSILSKILLFAAVFALIAALSLWVIGGYKEESEGSIEIAATPDQVFRVLVEPSQREQWLLHATQVELKSKPPIGLKTIFLTQYQETGKKYETRDEILQMVADEWLSIRMESFSSRLVTMFTLVRNGDQTRLKYKVSELPISYHRFLAPFRQIDQQGRIDEELIQIKRLVEQPSLSADSSSPGLGALRAARGENAEVEQPTVQMVGKTLPPGSGS